MHELIEKTCEALEDIEKSDKVNLMDSADRRIVSELVDLKKNLLKVEKLEDEMSGGYSERGNAYRDSGSYRGDDGGSSYARRGEHYVRGHYSRDGDRGGYSERRDSRGRYSRGGDMMEYVDAMLAEAPDQRTREMIEDFRAKMSR